MGSTLRTKRITLLVNIWLNHCPLDAEPLEDDVIEQLVTPWNSHEDGAGSRAVFRWRDVDLDAPTICQTVSVAASATSPAGSDEVVLAHRLVTVTYGASRRDLHAASATAAASLIQLDLGPGALTLTVGDHVVDDDEEDDDDDDEADGDDDDCGDQGKPKDNDEVREDGKKHES